MDFKKYALQLITPFITLVVGMMFMFALSFTNQQIQAQTTSSNTINVMPNAPQPGQTVRLNLSNQLAEPAVIDWLSNGTIIQSGGNLTSIEYTLPTNGNQLTITAEIDGELIAMTTITPSQLQLIAESKGYTPNTFRGAAPLTINSPVTVSALGISNNSRFVWRVNNRIVESASGFGRSNLLLSNIDRKLTIYLEAYNASGQLLNRGVILLDPQPIDLALYQDHPLRGPLFSYQLDNKITAVATSLGIVAIPFGSSEINPKTNWSFGNLQRQLSANIYIPNTNSGTLNANYNNGFGQRDAKRLQVTFQ